MKRRMKPVTDIEARPFPKLGWVNTLEGRGPLHIADKRGEQDRQRVSITRCNRAVRFYHYIGDGIVKDKPESVEALQSTFRLCGRCGSVEEFAAALELWRTGYMKQTEEHRERRAREDAERRTQWEIQCARFERLRAAIPFPTADDRHYGWVFEFEGVNYKIEERRPE